MIYDLYFHNDFDGWASAAIMLSFLEGRGDRIGHFVPIDHDLQEQWADDAFFKKHRLFAGKRNAPVVLDFPYHPGTAFWFDHHPTAFKKESWKRKFKEDRSHAYRPRYYSCCHMTYAMLKRNFGWHPPERFKELIAWLDVVDAARYASAEETIFMKDPAFAVTNFIDAEPGTAKRAAEVIRLLAERPLREIAVLPKVAAAGRRERKRALRNLAYYRKHLVVRGAATMIDLSADRTRLLRYAPYYLHPEIPYNVRITRKGAFYHLGLSKNPWSRIRGRIHAGRLMRTYGGGGHDGAGAAEFKDRKSVLRARDEIVERLNRT